MTGASTINLHVCLGALALTALVTGCASQSDDRAPTDVPTAPAAELSSELDHLHGLHIDPAGTVLAGTHTGLVAIDPSGGVARVGDSDDDFMGLTGVPGSDTLFSSGHPGRSSSAPNPLGLRISTDGGRTWTDRSLVGEVDFHALATDGTVVVGFGGGKGLRISQDGGTGWVFGAAVRAVDLAVTDAGVWVLTPDGLQLSTDTGQSVESVPEAPGMVLLAGARDALWGVDEQGIAWRSRDGRAWQRHSYIGPVQALTAADYDTAYAASSRSLYTLG